MNLKVGIIGCGGIANGKHLPALKQIKEANLVAFCDIEKDRAEKAAKEYGTEDAKVYTDYKEMLADNKLDVVHVCTPNSSHAELSIAAMEADAHVMCEKPMAKTTAEAEQMIEAAKKTGKKLTIGYQNRFRTDSTYLHEACEEGVLGDIYFAKAHAIRRRAVPTWGVFLDEEAQGSGPLIDIGTHALDLTLWMMDNYQPKYVVGKAYHELSQTENAANAWGPWDPKAFQVEDSAFGYVMMENGASIFLESSWALNSLEVGEAQTTLCGNKAGADMKHNGLTINSEDHGLLNEKHIATEAAGVAFYEGVAATPEYNEARSWYDAVINDTDPVVLPEQALVVTKILEGIYESSKTGQPFFFDK